MPYEITITESKFVANTPEGQPINESVMRLKMTIDGELDIPTVIKAITTGKRKRNSKKTA